ncbi:MAG: hypothetical protein ACI4E3_03390 [Candidatus Fimousia sp.]
MEFMDMTRHIAIAFNAIIFIWELKTLRSIKKEVHSSKIEQGLSIIRMMLLVIITGVVMEKITIYLCL